MRTYFDKQHVKDPYKGLTETNKNKTGKNDSQSPQKNNRNSSGRNNSGEGGHGGGRGRGGWGQGQNGQECVQSNDSCPLPSHAGHTWGKCRANQYSDDQQSGRPVGNYAGRGRGSKREAYAAESPLQANPQSGHENHVNKAPPSNQGEYFCFQIETGAEDFCEAESFFLTQDELEPEHYQPNPVPTIHSKPIKLCSAVDSMPAFEMVDMAPTTLLVVKKINDKEGRYFFKSLFDSGDTSVMVNKRATIPKDCEICEICKYDGRAFATTQGSFTSPGFVYLTDLALPEFTLTRRIQKFKAYIFDAPYVRYDLIYGQSFLLNVGIDILNSSQSCTWLEQSILPFHPIDYFGDKAAMRQLLTVKTVRAQKAEAYLSDMTATKDSSGDVREIADAQKHLTPLQREQLYEVLAKQEGRKSLMEAWAVTQTASSTLPWNLEPSRTIASNHTRFQSTNLA
jgi:hypothetical protein